MLHILVRKYEMLHRIRKLHRERLRFAKKKYKKTTTKGAFLNISFQKECKNLEYLIKKYTKQISKMQKAWYFDPNVFDG